MESIYSLAARERRLTEGRSISLEDISMRSETGTVSKDVSTRPKEQRERKVQEVEAADIGLKIYSAATNKFPEQITYEEIVEGAKKGKYKITYTVKKTESEIIGMLVKKTIKISENELKVVTDDVFRKIRQGREHTPPSKPTKKLWQK